jgi:hypothetical protein
LYSLYAREGGNVIAEGGMSMKKALLFAGAAMLLVAGQGSGADSSADDDRGRFGCRSTGADDESRGTTALLHGTFGASIRETRPNETRIGLGHAPGVPRLGVPDLFESDVSLGGANGGEMRKGDIATALPPAWQRPRASIRRLLRRAAE